MENSKNNSLRATVLKRRYLQKDANGNVVETEGEMFRRVATAVAAIEARYGATAEQIRAKAKQFYRLMSRRLFLPNSPTLMNAGRERGMLSACFVLPVEDSIDGIFDAVKQTALVQKAGGGTGFAFDRLRPTGDIVASSGGRTSGPLSFMKVFSEATQAIQQGAFRRGANMAMMSVHHPDIVSFIHAKSQPDTLCNFNISAKATDSFMERLSSQPHSTHVIVNPRSKKQHVIPRSVRPDAYSIDELPLACEASDDCLTTQDIWDMIITQAHATGEPGICFIDRVNQNNPTSRLGSIEATNPCGEQPLLPYEACTLGSINVSGLIDRQGGLNWDKLSETVHLAVRFLDNVVDAGCYPIAEVESITLANRKVGLGVMGFADALILRGIRYDSEQAVQFAEELMAFINETAHQASENLAAERGSFANWKGSTWQTELNRPMRNAAATTIAPTGSISVLAECSSGIEPVFSFVSKRRALDGEEFTEIHPLLERLGRQQRWLTANVRRQLEAGEPLQNITQIPEAIARTLITAHDIPPEWHIRIQAAFQKNCDNAVSKTVNLPAMAKRDDVDRIYRLAFESGCKGITVYRDGCRANQVLSGSTTSFGCVSVLKTRPKTTTGATIKARTGCGTLFTTVNSDSEGLCEVFANLGKAGGCPAQSEATCRAVSAALRCGVSPAILIEQLKGIRCLSTIARRKDSSEIDVLSCPDAIARAIEEAMGKPQSMLFEPQNDKCPECKGPLRREMGCKVCYRCGFNKCR